MQSHEAWLKIAKEELMSSKELLKFESFSTITYLCQQSAEKMLKGYLVLKQQPVVKTHDLLQLIELCMKFDQSFKSVAEAAKQLNPFSTKFRYPTEYDIPDKADAEHAIKHAEVVMTFVTKKIAEPETGQIDLF